MPVRPLVFLITTLLMLSGCAKAPATLRVQDAWARATPPGAAVGAVYLTIHAGDSADKLVEVSTDVCDRVEMHTTSHEEGQMQMRPVESVDITPDQTVSFAPGGLHMMLMDLKQPLTEGAELPLRLRFEHAGTVEIRAKVKALDYAGPADASAEHSH